MSSFRRAVFYRAITVTHCCNSCFFSTQKGDPSAANVFKKIKVVVEAEAEAAAQWSFIVRVFSQSLVNCNFVFILYSFRLLAAIAFQGSLIPYFV